MNKKKKKNRNKNFDFFLIFIKFKIIENKNKNYLYFSKRFLIKMSFFIVFKLKCCKNFLKEIPREIIKMNKRQYNPQKLDSML